MSQVLTDGDDNVVAAQSTIYGLDGNDTIKTSQSGPNVYGGEGNDFLGNQGTGTGDIFGGRGNDTLHGGEGTDRLNGDSGGDLIVGGEFLYSGASAGNIAILLGEVSGDDTIYGGDGIDSLWGLDGDDIIYGGEGNDSNAFNVITPNGFASGNYTIPGGLYGGSGNDFLDGDRGNDVLDGGSGTDNLNGGQGNDILFGGSEADSLYGGEDNDNLYGGAGADVLSGGTGYDYACYELGGSGVVVRLDFHSGSGGEAAGDLIGDDVEGVIGTNFADTLVGDEKANVLVGNAGNDTILGGGGADSLVGGAGTDDLLGQAGADILIGGADADNFYFAAVDNVVGQFDTINDFQDGLDRIYLQGWNPATLAATEANGNVYITTLDSNYSTGVIVVGATAAQVLDQVFLV